MVIVWQNYNIAAYIGVTRHETTRIIAVLYTGAGSGLIEHLLIRHELQKFVRPTESQVSVNASSNRLVPIAAAFNFLVNFQSRSAILKFDVFERLEKKVILGREFCDAHVEDIRPGKRVIELANVSTVPIFKGPQIRSIHLVTVPRDQ